MNLKCLIVATSLFSKKTSIFILVNKLSVLGKDIGFFKLYDNDNFKRHVIMNCIANSGANLIKVALSGRGSQKCCGAMQERRQATVTCMPLKPSV